ncbi:hypothetical protein EDB87DRAFT_1800610 [Lactarius vividus]|nr:hypothetical protein EDB87DRAFT_1800610 [Lactarius vividus]
MNSAVSPHPNGEPIVRHDEYYIHGGDVIFRVENYLFRVHRFFFTRDSTFFRDELLYPPPPGEFTKGSSDNNPFILENTLRVDFERFLWVFYNPTHSIYEASVEEWTSILKLAHQWNFVEAKTLALRGLEQLEIPALQKILIYRAHDIDQHLLQEAYAALILRDEPVSIEEGRELGLGTTLRLAHAREIARAPVNLAGVELDALIQDLFQLSAPIRVYEHPSTLQTPTGRGTPTGGRNTPQLGIQTNGTGHSISNSHRGGLVMNAYLPVSSHAGSPVQVRVVPPTGSPMATQTERPMTTAAAGRVALEREGRERVSESQNKSEPRGKEVDLKTHQSEPAAMSVATDTIKGKEAAHVQGSASNPKGVVENKGQGPVRKPETVEQGSGKARQERPRTQSKQSAIASASTLDLPSDRPRSHTAKPTKKEQLKIDTTVSSSEPPKRSTTLRPTLVPASATASSSTQTQHAFQHKKQSASTPASGLFGFVSSIIGSAGDPGYESSSRESEGDPPIVGAWRLRDTKSRQGREKAEAEAKARAQAQEETRRRLEAEAWARAEEKARREAEDKARKEAEDKVRKEAEEQTRKEQEEDARAKKKVEAEAKIAASVDIPVYIPAEELEDGVLVDMETESSDDDAPVIVEMPDAAAITTIDEDEEWSW